MIPFNMEIPFSPIEQLATLFLGKSLVYILEMDIDYLHTLGRQGLTY